jgi:SAM-dependent methyltransferase
VATILSDWSYRYQWLYDGISRLAAVSIAGEARLRQLAMLGLTIHPHTKVLDLCCGSGQATQFFVKYSQNVTGCLHLWIFTILLIPCLCLDCGRFCCSLRLKRLGSC